VGKLVTVIIISFQIHPNASPWDSYSRLKFKIETASVVFCPPVSEYISRVCEAKKPFQV